jgi:hypothetical protein
MQEAYSQTLATMSFELPEAVLDSSTDRSYKYNYFLLQPTAPPNFVREVIV